MINYPRLRSNCWNKGVFLFFLEIFLSLSPSFIISVPAEEMKIVAVVNEEVITEADLNQAFLPVYLQMQSTYDPEELAEKAPEMKRKVLQQLVEERLMLQEAKHPKPVEVAKGKVGALSPITVSDGEVERMLTETKSKFSNPEELTDALNEQGLTLEGLKSRFRDQIMIQKLVDRQIRVKIAISPAEVNAYYEAHPNEFDTSPAVQGAVILIKPKGTLDLTQARDLAQHLHEQLLQGADFYDLAKRYSDGPNPKMGGRFGFLEKGKSLPEVDRALFSLKEGQVSPVIQTPAGFYLLRVESIRPGRHADLTEVKTQIQDRIFQQKTVEKYKEWIAKLKEDAYISISSSKIE